MEDVLRYFPNKLSNIIGQNDLNSLEEIRIRVNKPVILKFTENKEVVLDNLLINQNELLNILQFICDNSVYTYQNQICNGFITVRRGS